jgi:lipopolysaccharide transport system permease protein
MTASAVRVLAPPRWRHGLAVEWLGRLREYGDLLVVLTRHRINVRYKQSVLGGAWAVLQPFAMMLVFTVVFSRLVRVPSDGVPYALFAYAGLLPWTFFATAVSNATGSLVGHGTLITKVSFPREILPLSYVITAIVDLLIGAAGLLAVALWFEVAIGWRLLAALPIVVVFSGFALACALLLSIVQVHFRDVGMALPVGLQLWLFGSPILYPLSVVPESWRSWYVLNPIVGFVDGFRRTIVGLPLDLAAIGVAALMTAIFLPAAYLVFKYLEATVADVV